MQPVDLMGNSGKHCPDGSPSFSAGNEACLADCEAKAKRLLDVLSEESKTLRQFDSGHLLQIVARKDYCLGVLCEALGALPTRPTKGMETEDSSARETLRRLLAEIDRMNRANAVFIEGALDHYQDLISTLTPTVYGQNERSPQRLMDCKGATIQKRA